MHASKFTWKYLPASPLSEYIDDVRQALGAALPVGLQATLYAVGVAGGDGVDDLFMFGNGEMQIMNDGAGIEAPVALRLRLNGFVQREDARAGSGLNNHAMKVVVEIENAGGFCRTRLHNFIELLVVALQVLHDLGTLRLRQRRGAPSRETLDATDDGIQLAGVFFGERCHYHARFADVLMFQHVALALEPVQGAADGGAAHAHAVGKIAFDDPCSRRQLAVDDQLTYFLECRVQAGAVLGPGGAGFFLSSCHSFEPMDRVKDVSRKRNNKPVTLWLQRLKNNSSRPECRLI